MSSEVNMIPTSRKFGGGDSQSKFEGAIFETFFRGGPVKKKHPVLLGTGNGHISLSFCFLCESTGSIDIP